MVNDGVEHAQVGFCGVTRAGGDELHEVGGGVFLSVADVAVGFCVVADVEGFVGFDVPVAGEDHFHGGDDGAGEFDHEVFPFAAEFDVFLL